MAMESEMSVREMRSSGTDKNEKDSIRQLRNEFKTAIKDLRNDVCAVILIIIEFF
jgi:hypothetical protein